jgi:hypothetical protein
MTADFIHAQSNPLAISQFTVVKTLTLLLSMRALSEV